MVLLIFLVVFFVGSVCHTITLLDVPRWADPRRPAQLQCHYTRRPNDAVLHSVKWYRDTDEIFRYTSQQDEIRLFNSSGVVIANSTCGSRACTIYVVPEPGSGRYTCEVSTEGPRFEVDRRSANMTTAVLPEYEPLITGLPTLVQAGEQALVNCTSDYSLPAATIEWYVDSELQEDPVVTGTLHVSGADGDGLRAAWRTLHVFPDDYSTHRGFLSLECRARVPTRPPHERSMAVRLFVASRPHISSFMLSKNAVGGSGAVRFHSELTAWTLLLLVRSRVPLLVN
ncbi:uncharacterized protein LOC121732566 [Aricia agestis]|uniref:uncharacterized protein LOC121732566 n=1 Tax=Aricia agestis TaxID=91739 RepID=UPI001C20A731|nr:uncharacterized protein LOC121732566 [Aricia agestis]